MADPLRFRTARATGGQPPLPRFRPAGAATRPQVTPRFRSFGRFLVRGRTVPRGKGLAALGAITATLRAITAGRAKHPAVRRRPRLRPAPVPDRGRPGGHVRPAARRPRPARPAQGRARRPREPGTVGRHGSGPVPGTEPATPSRTRRRRSGPRPAHSLLRAAPGPVITTEGSPTSTSLLTGHGPRASLLPVTAPTAGPGFTGPRPTRVLAGGARAARRAPAGMCAAGRHAWAREPPARPAALRALPPE